MAASRSWYRDLFEECGEFAEEARGRCCAKEWFAAMARGPDASVALPFPRSSAGSCPPSS